MDFSVFLAGALLFLTVMVFILAGIVLVVIRRLESLEVKQHGQDTGLHKDKHSN